MGNLSAYLYKDEAACVDALVGSIDWTKKLSGAVEKRAEDLIKTLRASKRKMGELESFLQQYSLQTEEGLSLMCLAEALLRIPDKTTANALIRDKVVAADWLQGLGDSKDWMVKAAGVGLMMTSKSLDSVMSRMAQPVIREAMGKAMQMMGGQFVLGRDIHEAIKNAVPYQKKGYRMSYDMLGEGARTADDAEHYFKAYAKAIGDIAAANLTGATTRKSSISVKLSALHPRYEFAQKEACIPAIAEKLKALAEMAASHKISLFVDAEETERLEISLEIFEGVLSQNIFEGWDHFGLAVQAYSKRCYPLIEKILELAKKYKRKIPVRLVKGAYWDSEVKKAQIRNYPDYPVFTRKANTDLSYLACADLMLQNTKLLYPMFATHNAYTAAAILELAKKHKAKAGEVYEFQRLHGMGEALFDTMLKDEGVAASIYAPVGPHKDLLPYLVRRLLENGANTSFVNKILDKKVPVKDLLEDPVEAAKNHATKRHPHLVMPAKLYGDERDNSLGMDFNDAGTAKKIMQHIAKFKPTYEAAPLIGGEAQKYGNQEDVINPASGEKVGTVWNTGPRRIEAAFARGAEGFAVWSKTPAAKRAEALTKIADLFEQNMFELMTLCVKEAGKTIPDALGELREAVDFCRYYAAQGRTDFEGVPMPGPTGEDNTLQLEGRGVFVCISPWNFPLAIFTGQVVAALMAGNAVLAKPAEQTPLVAMRAVELMHLAGIPKNVLQLLPGDGNIGALLVQHKDVAGVAFTGSTEVAREINKTLAGKDGPIVPLIAETGGQNAMIVDSSALPEQVVDDVIVSAFGSAGQRCSALRVLFLQNDIADKTLNMLKGAMQEIRMGDPAKLATDIGPVIDDHALGILIRHHKNLEGFGRLVAQVPMDESLRHTGTYFAPCAYEIANIYGLSREIFGPVLHVIRFEAKEVDDVLDQINATGYGLTLGVHSRIETFQKKVAEKIRAGNIYINRSMIGAVVGTQPFGGMGLSGTGPKAGGPHYLHRFATEKTISVNTTAAGGNTSLVMLVE